MYALIEKNTAISAAILLILSCQFFVSGCKKEPKEKTGNIEGIITNAFNQPIEKAKVVLSGMNYEQIVVSTVEGKYNLNYISAGQYQMNVSKDGYLTASRSIEVLAEQQNIQNFTLEAGAESLEISQDTLLFFSATGSQDIDIQSNIPWAASSDSAWLSATPSVGAGNSKLKIKVQPNPSGVMRTGELTVSGGAISKKIKVTQLEALKLLSYTDGHTMMDDSIYLLFNHPVTVVSIEPLWEFCLPDNLGYRMFDDGKGFKFRYQCGRLGLSFNFVIRVKENSSGYQYTYNLAVNFYTNQRTFEGDITEYFLSDDNQYCWVGTSNPNRIYKVSTADMSILKEFPSDETPIKIRTNPYDGYLYVAGGEKNKIDVLNPDNGVVVKTITFHPDQYDHPQAPAIYPADVMFGANGYGIVLLFAHGSSAQRWKVIESTKNDSVYIHPQSEFPFSNWIFDEVYINYDHSKILLIYPAGSTLVGILDTKTKEITEFVSASTTRYVFLQPNKLDETMYFGYLYDQFIQGLNSGPSQFSYIDNRNYGSADFSYNPAEKGYVYFCDSYNFQLLDYNTAQTKFYTAPLGGLLNLQAATNGKFILLRREKQLFRFDTSMFSEK